jgi:hypothetical protein
MKFHQLQVSRGQKSMGSFCRNLLEGHTPFRALQMNIDLEMSLGENPRQAQLDILG